MRCWLFMWVGLVVSMGQTIKTCAAPEVATTSTGKWHDSGRHGAVVAGGAEAVDVGLAMLRNGGNATDSAVATILALSVTDSGNFCFGGELAIIVYDARHQRIETISGQGAAPKLATRELFTTGGIPRSGVRAATVPAVLDACTTMLARYGTKTFSEVAQPTIDLLAGRQEKWHADLKRTLERLVEAEKSDGGAAGSKRNEGPESGPSLPTDPGTQRVAALQRVAHYFYRGPLAQEMAAWCTANNGLLRADDLAAHTTRIIPPVSVTYRGHTVYKCGPWTQGPWLLEALGLLAGFDLKQMGHHSPEAIHRSVEAMKLAMADRDVYYADPEYADVPIEQLLSHEYASLRRPLIDPTKASLEQLPGDPRGGKALLDVQEARKGLGNPNHDTTTCLVADGEGNVVAATPSGWSGVLVGNTGVWLGSRLQSFNCWEGHPNCIAPGKRPRITLTPTLVMGPTQGGQAHVTAKTPQNKPVPGRPVLAVSVAGGDGQDQASLQMVLNAIDFGLAPRESVTAIRFGTNHYTSSFGQAPPELGSLLIYPTADPRTIAELQSRGHKVTLSGPPLWSPSLLAIDPATGEIKVAGDPKTGRHAAAY